MPNTVPETLFPDQSRPVLHVVAAVIENEQGEILISQRAKELHQGGLWEFPGGKVEANETVKSALCRELREELGITPTRYHPLITIPYTYPEHHVLLDVWRVTDFSGIASGLEQQPVIWVKRAELDEYKFPPANHPIINAARLPDTLLITPEPGVKSQWGEFLDRIDTLSQNGISLILLRSKQLSDSDYRTLAHMVVEVTSIDDCQVLLNSNWDDVMDSRAAGLHLTQSQLQSQAKMVQRSGLLLSTSCHNQTELVAAVNAQVDFALLSPVKATRSHPQATPIGWHQFNQLVYEVTLPIYALGGLSDSDLQDAKQYGAQGIAAISSLWNSDES